MYETSPAGYRHWRLTIEPPIATLALLRTAPEEPMGGGGGRLALPLPAEVELADAVERLRFERPDVSAVVVTGATGDTLASSVGALPAGAPSDAVAALLAAETRDAIEEAGADSGQRWLAALNGSIGGAGYDLALATEEVLLIDDGRASVALAELAQLGAVPLAGALRRLLIKRGVRRDLVDVACTRPEGIGGRLARDWGFVDQLLAPERFPEAVRAHALAAAGEGRRAPRTEGVELGPLCREDFDGGFAYPDLRVDTDREAGTATLTVVAPKSLECFAPQPGPNRLRSSWWPLAACRALDNALLRLRHEWPAIHSLILRTEGDPLAVAAADVALTTGFDDDWFAREVVLFWRRTLKRLERAPQSIAAFIEPGSCFVGTLLEFALAADRTYMLDGTDASRPGDSPAEILLTSMNFGPLPDGSGLTRLGARFPRQPDRLERLAVRVGDPIRAAEAAELGLVTAVVAGADWPGATRRFLTERGALDQPALARFIAGLRSGRLMSGT